MSIVLKLCRRFSTVPASVLNDISLTDLEKLRRDNSILQSERAIAFAELQGRLKQLSKVEVPFYTVHQDLPKVQQDKLDAIDKFMDGLTDIQRRYLQYAVILRMKHLQTPLKQEYYEEIKPSVVKEAALLKTQSMSRRLNELMTRSKEELIALIK